MRTKKGKGKEPWAVWTELGWTLSAPLREFEVAQVAARSPVAAGDVGLGKQMKIWFIMESYATRVKVSGRSREGKKALERPKKTTKLVYGNYETS